MKSSLICTFTKGYAIDSTIDNILTEYENKFDTNKLFLFGTDQRGMYIISYNLLIDNEVEFYNNSILVHRKKETNTMYTINAINELIKTVNNGVLDKSYKIEWELYRNCLLISADNSFKRINTYLKKIYEI